MLAQASYNAEYTNNKLKTYKAPGWWFLDNKLGDMSEFIGWEMVADKSGIGGFYAALYKKEDNLVFSFRGSDNFADIGADAAIVNGLNWQSPTAKVFIIEELENYIIEEDDDTKVYITGHSLGGYLSQKASAEVFRDGRFIDNVVTSINFNAPGVQSPGEYVDKINTLDMLYSTDYKLLKENVNKVENWRIYRPGLLVGDSVSLFGLHAGEMNEIAKGQDTEDYENFPFPQNLNESHMMSNFLEDELFE